ncbi:hypothetical protein KSX_47160 [Ktedonospora formicarum]|uniref:Photosynthesis system II assembly factor Ycf48/Hcf136-like domain-containing protein n=2 Tax=Ktedonospora formicarum TaxID=2778364 RepID=A0A8J3I459_9CHLR|nr:hypothetical protein KSX_47160 [Ktedonospora formicarum]
MVTSTQGWALTKDKVLKTTDGGQHWMSMTSQNAPSYAQAKGTFIDMNNAWIVSAQQTENKVTIQHTTDGGQTWQATSLNVSDPAGVDMLHLISTDGWLEVTASPGAGSQGAYIFRTNDGGQTWKQISQSGSDGGIGNGGFKSGISFMNAKTGFATTRSTTGQPSDPGLYRTSDSGANWEKRSLTPPTGLTVEQMGTTPPVFFGNTGILPVYIVDSKGQQRFVLYRSTDSGANWTSMKVGDFEGDSVYVLDPTHAWVSDNNSGKLYYTSDGGTTWTASQSQTGKVNEMSFIDASNGWATTDGKLLHTSDGGQTWTSVNYTIQ